MSRERFLDVAWLEPPEPMERSLTELESLTRDEVLVMRIHRQPYMLFNMLRQQGYTYSCEPTPDGLFQVRITLPVASPD
ncbi:DUF2249 domain-containing protein [Chitinivorax sp. B]|uniref:DUF2249 domain-containing protein n=1 Tax=Chitinivorax sp. B TaxID=2502235 RepID=UPI0014850D04|nr:DUF2249 domain-containing protein [Chitinivorax sp. B]